VADSAEKTGVSRTENKKPRGFNVEPRGYLKKIGL